MENMPRENIDIEPEQRMATGEWDIVMAAAKKEHEKAKRLDKAIAEAEQAGKEPFDYGKFTDSYWRKNAFSEPLDGDESEAMVERYKEEYYLEFPEAKTVEEFAAELEKRDESLGE